ncbi:hypothetical protein [Parasphingorhabdus sp.]|uniref:hypothetical protein n=1 Tax=Parasphingorhabdus sp. TaxID=2709688 RepID=UPI0032666894
MLYQLSYTPARSSGASRCPINPRALTASADKGKQDSVLAAGFGSKSAWKRAQCPSWLKNGKFLFTA